MIKFIICVGGSSYVIHSIRFVDEDYYKDYADVRKRRFKARKLKIEKIVRKIVNCSQIEY